MLKAPDIFHAKEYGQVAPWADLVNSEEWDGFGKLTDHLANTSWLTAFLKHWNLTPTARKAVSLGKLKRLRTLMRTAAEQFAAGRTLRRRDLVQLNRALNVPARQRFVEDQNGFRAELIPVKRDGSWVIARIAASLGEMLANGAVHRIKTCANSGCRWVFFDPTKAKTKLWCNDRTCGNRARVRRARAARH